MDNVMMRMQNILDKITAAIIAFYIAVLSITAFLVGIDKPYSGYGNSMLYLTTVVAFYIVVYNVLSHLLTKK